MHRGQCHVLYDYIITVSRILRERRTVTVHAPLSVTAAAQECEACAAGLYSDNPAASTCDACRKTFYSVAGADKCSPCQALGCETAFNDNGNNGMAGAGRGGDTVTSRSYDHCFIGI